MAAATAARPTKSRNLGAKRKHELAADAVIYAGTMLMLKSDGYGDVPAASAGNRGVVGVATETVDNTGGSDGDLSVEVQEGDFLFAGSTLAKSVEGAAVYGEDNQTVDETQDANQPQAGKAVEFVDASSVWVAIGMAFAS